MADARIDIRNRQGKQVCTIHPTDKGWKVSIKDHKCYTILTLYPDGTYKVQNTNPLKIEELAKAIMKESYSQSKIETNDAGTDDGEIAVLNKEDTYE